MVQVFVQNIKTQMTVFVFKWPVCIRVYASFFSPDKTVKKLKAKRAHFSCFLWPLVRATTTITRKKRELAEFSVGVNIKFVNRSNSKNNCTKCLYDLYIVLLSVLPHQVFAPFNPNKRPKQHKKESPNIVIAYIGNLIPWVMDIWMDGWRYC